jgi:hypothetical protein
MKEAMEYETARSYRKAVQPARDGAKVRAWDRQ